MAKSTQKDNPFAWNEVIQKMQQIEICEIMPNVVEHINTVWHNAFEENPLKDGRYFCTCASTWQGNVYKFIATMEFENGRWHDCGHVNGCSNKVIGWADIPMYKKEFTVEQVRDF